MILCACALSKHVVLLAAPATAPPDSAAEIERFET